MKGSPVQRYLSLLILTLVACGWRSGMVQADSGQASYTSPKAAVKALVSAVQSPDKHPLLTVLGPSSQDLVSTGDAVAERRGRAAFLSAYAHAHCLMSRTDGSVVLHIGTENWPFPIPLVKQGSQWHFDTQAGREDILNRRIGGNEINAVKVCEAYVQAQREYASQVRTGDGIIQYAQHLHSSGGQHDGLYWKTRAGEPVSPLGPLVAQAAAEGYTDKTPHGPYLGYHFHILTKQGDHAPGGAYDYVINGHMVAGFALVAWPEKYGVTGIMTYVVNQNGIIYKKDLGQDSDTQAPTQTEYNPDDTWTRL